jgi:glycosyltransferase involved in cell wall biosynthesis
MQLIKNCLWLSWHDHTRSRSLAKELGIPFVPFVKYDSGIQRHIFGSFWTCWILATRRPRIIFLQNSFMLTLACAVYKRFRWRSNVTIINDCHNKSLARRTGGLAGPLFWKLKTWSFAQVDCIVISNGKMLSKAQVLGDAVVVLRDPLGSNDVVAARPDGIGGSMDRYVFFVCSFAEDEPIDAIRGSVGALSGVHGVRCVVSGRGANGHLGADVANDRLVQCPGFLPFEDYWRYLAGAATVVVLTTDPDCLVCGGYEGLSAGRPLVLSDSEVLRYVFGEGAEYAPNDSGPITEAVLRALTMSESRMRRARVRFQEDFDQEWASFVGQIEQIKQSRS